MTDGIQAPVQPHFLHFVLLNFHYFSQPSTQEAEGKEWTGQHHVFLSGSENQHWKHIGSFWAEQTTLRKL